MWRAAGARVAVVCVAAVAVSACATGAAGDPQEPTATPPPSPGNAPSESTTPEAEQTSSALDELDAWVRDAEWSYGAGGTQAPVTVEMTGGTATDDHGRAYEVGPGVEGDANGDAVPDALFPVTRVDGNSAEELWYIWLGRAADGGPLVGDQVIYPIARQSNCGDAVHAVTAIDAGFRIDETLRMTTDTSRDCAEGGTGDQIRDVSVVTIDGTAYPVQTEPAPAWGGVCPRSSDIHGFTESGYPIRVAPAESAPLGVDPDENVQVFALDPAPLVQEDGEIFLAYVQGESGSEAVIPSCGFLE